MIFCDADVDNENDLSGMIEICNKFGYAMRDGRFTAIHRRILQTMLKMIPELLFAIYTC